MKLVKPNKTREMLKERYLDALKEDKIPWERGWGASRLYNGTSNHTYKGVNKILLQYGTMSRIRTHLIDTFFIFKTSFVIVRRFIVTMTVNPNCIVKCFDIFKYHLVCHLIINDLFSIQPLSFN